MNKYLKRKKGKNITPTPLDNKAVKFLENGRHSQPENFIWKDESVHSENQASHNLTPKLF